MATTTKARPARTTRPEAATPDGLRFDPPQGQARHPRLSWLALGIAVLLAASLFGAVLLAQVADRTAVLALAEPIERGQPLTREHLRVVNIAADEHLQLLAADTRSELLGLTATASLPAGTLLTADHLSPGPGLEAGFSVVGLALQPGEYPTTSLAAGDPVEVVRTPDPNSVRSDGAAGAAVLTDTAEVFAVEPLSETNPGLMVSLAVPEDAAPAVAAAAGAGRVRLVLVPAR